MKHRKPNRNAVREQDVPKPRHKKRILPQKPIRRTPRGNPAKITTKCYNCKAEIVMAPNGGTRCRICGRKQKGGK